MAENTSNPNPNSRSSIDVAVAQVAKLEKEHLDAWKKGEPDNRQDLESRLKEVHISIPKDPSSTGEAGGETSVNLGALPNQFRLIRNLLWIEQHPVYQKALDAWELDQKSFQARIERRKKLSGDLKTDIFNVFGFYSVFQGVLLTASAQSSYLHCRNVGLPIVFSAFASVGTLWHISQKFQQISKLSDQILTLGKTLSEVDKKVADLRNAAESFRFSEYENRSYSEKKKHFVCGVRTESWYIVFFTTVLFSVVFVVAHPLILCRPGPA